ncbi:MAG: DUF948 domain-containing protein [Nitrospirae bacterium]|nr:DUF948 domain-containing protein [Nitrospirota bacterium]
MGDIAIIIMALAVLVLVVFLIPLLFEIKRTLQRFNTFMDRTEAELLPTVEELRGTLHNMKAITEDVETVTENVKDITSLLEETVKALTGVRNVIYNLQKETNATIAGLREGVKTGFKVFVKSLTTKGGV